MNEKELNINKVDKTTSIIAGTVSLIPCVGGALSEIIHCTIPKQRTERIVSFIKELNQKFEKMEYSMEKIKKVFSNYKYGTFTYNCLREVANDIYDEKIKYYKNLCIDALTNDEKNLLHCERILKILSELDYYEILYLELYNNATILRNDKVDEIRKKLGFSNLLPTYMFCMSDEEIEQETYKQITLNNLCNSGLLLKEPKVSRNGGKVKYSYKITQLGKLILKKIELDNIE